MPIKRMTTLLFSAIAPVEGQKGGDLSLTKVPRFAITSRWNVQKRTKLFVPFSIFTGDAHSVQKKRWAERFGSAHRIAAKCESG